MGKFKVGDKVVVISKDEFDAKENGISYGESFIISNHIGPHNGSWHVDVYEGEGFSYGYFDYEIELESVYNSPLYQALR